VCSALRPPRPSTIRPARSRSSFRTSRVARAT
jgi:hypothetical protein